MKNLSSKKINLIVLTLCVLIAGTFIGLKSFQNQSFQDIEGVNFGIWHLSFEQSDYRLNKESVNYDANAGVLTFVMAGPNGRNLTFTEQAVPESISGQTDVFELQLKSLPEVAKFDSINGPVSITHPTGTDQATAIMRSKGTLMSVHSNKQMSIENWRKLFNKMEIKI